MHDDTSAHAHRTDAHQHCGAPVAVIDHKPITHNLKQLRHVLACNGPERTPRIWAVAKADAYGHTLEHAYPGLSGADGLAVLTLDEARHCRALGWTGPRSEEHTSELQSLMRISYAVFCLKNKKTKNTHN